MGWKRHATSRQARRQRRAALVPPLADRAPIANFPRVHTAPAPAVAAAPATPPRRADPRQPEQRPEVQFFHGLNRVYVRTYHQVDCQTSLQLPRTGPAILVSNHVSALDPLLLQSVSRRVIVWMMAREYYEIAAMKWFFKAIDAIAVDRSGRDTAATRAALRALKDGRVLGIFPEGKIETTRDLLPFQTGVAMMALKTDVPIYPAYIDGTNRGQEMVEAFTTSNRARLRFGEPFRLTPTKQGRPDLDISTGQIQLSVNKLRMEMGLGEFKKKLQKGGQPVEN